MDKHFLLQPLVLLGSLIVICGHLPAVHAQSLAEHPVHFRVTAATERLEMIVNTSRILTMEDDIPRLLVNNPEIVQATPLSPNQVQLSALQPGVTQLNMWDENEQIYTVDVVVGGDARQLQDLLNTLFPNTTITVRPLAQSVILSGFVPSADMVGQIVRVAEDYYPNVINNLTVSGVQQVLLHVKVMEVSRTKLKAAGFDWQFTHPRHRFHQSGVSTGREDITLEFGILRSSSDFVGFLDLLRENELIKVLAEPTLVATSGRPARFHAGGQFGFLMPQGTLDRPQVDFIDFGTQVDFVPIVLGDGRIRLEVRPIVSEIDHSLGVADIPGFRTRSVDTGVEMKAGQTLALAGLIQNRVETINRGVPVLADLPWLGAVFRSMRETNNEIELVILVTPEFVDAMDPHQVPPIGPGGHTTSPTDTELYGRGYVEVPKHFGGPAFCPEGNVLPPVVTPHEYGAGSFEYEYEVVPQPEPQLDGPQASGTQNDGSRSVLARPASSGHSSQAGPSLIGPIGYDELHQQD